MLSSLSHYCFFFLNCDVMQKFWIQICNEDVSLVEIASDLDQVAQPGGPTTRVSVLFLFTWRRKKIQIPKLCVFIYNLDDGQKFKKPILQIITHHHQKPSDFIYYFVLLDQVSPIMQICWYTLLAWCPRYLIIGCIYCVTVSDPSNQEEVRFCGVIVSWTSQVYEDIVCFISFFSTIWPASSSSTS
jgi:hypothetical protein